MARVKQKEGEDLSDFTISKVIKLLEDEKPITKREACEILRINYNTTRLAKIINQYQERKAIEKQRRKEMRSKPITDAEIARMVTMYLQGSSFEDISSSTFRTTTVVKRELEKAGVPRHDGKTDYFHPDLIPDDLIKESYEVDDVVWSAKYGGIAQVTKELSKSEEHGNVYQLWLFGKNCRFIAQPWYELGHLECLKKYNINVKQLVD